MNLRDKMSPLLLNTRDFVSKLSDKQKRLEREKKEEALEQELTDLGIEVFHYDKFEYDEFKLD